MGSEMCIRDSFIPSAEKVFVDAYHPLRLLHRNDYVMEKAFVFGVIALSKWLGSDRYPPGLYGEWPPEPPPEIYESLSGPVVEVDL